MDDIDKKLRVKVLDDDEYQKAIQEPDGVLICIPGKCTVFEDAIVGKCDTCGCKIHYRPDNKNATQKICIDCAEKLCDNEE